LLAAPALVAIVLVTLAAELSLFAPVVK